MSWYLYKYGSRLASSWAIPWISMVMRVPSNQCFSLATAWNIDIFTLYTMRKLLKIKFWTFFPQYTNKKYCSFSGCYAVAVAFILSSCFPWILSSLLNSDSSRNFSFNSVGLWFQVYILTHVTNLKEIQEAGRRRQNIAVISIHIW